MRINKDRLIACFTDLVSIDSRSFDERETGEFIQRHLEALGFSVSEDDAGKRFNGSCGNIYGFKKGGLEGEPLLFCAHMDTVEPSGGKQAIIGENGVIKSNGKTVLGADDCAGIAAILEALHVLEERSIPRRSVEVLFTIAEELYCKGAEQFDFSRINAKEAYVLDLMGPIGLAAHKAPTILSFNVTVTGRSSHAGFAPQEGVHSIAAAADAIGKLRMGRLDEETTLNVGVIQGGLATNIVPERCSVSGEIRSYSHAKALRTADVVKKHFADSAGVLGASIDFQLQLHCEAYETRLDHPVVKRFERVCGERGLQAVLQPTFGGSDNNCLAKHGIHGLVIANAMHQCHSCEEYTTVEELCAIAELTLSLMVSEH